MYETHLWVYWLSIATDHDVAGRRLERMELEWPLGPSTARVVDAELEHALVAVTGAALAIDGFYGAVKPMISIPLGLLATWDRNRTRRGSRIFETLKIGFDVPAQTPTWSADLRWLYRLRDQAVHPTVSTRPMVRRRSGMSMPAVDPDFPALAPCAVQIATRIIRTCLTAPRASNATLVAWCDQAKRDAVDAATRPRELIIADEFSAGPARFPELSRSERPEPG